MTPTFTGHLLYNPLTLGGKMSDDGICFNAAEFAGENYACRAAGDIIAPPVC
jgi:hypothetical protein